jgi:ribonuclease HII
MPNLDYENSYLGKIVAGVDEAGRGPLCGPVVAAAVIIDKENIIDGIDDSKKLSKVKREKFYDFIVSNYIFAIGEASVEEIDELNILEATKLACVRAVNSLRIDPDIILVDGNMEFVDARYNSIIKGDSISISISAASIIAKVHRDRIMDDLDKSYPEYLWSKNSGYGTKDHISALLSYGPTVHHRKKFIRKIQGI